jgi:two-component system sensor histidine kinase UhpB
MKLHLYLGRRLGLATAGVLLLFLVLAISQAVLSIHRERSAMVHLLELSAQIEALQTAQGSEFERRLQDLLQLSREGDFRHVEVRITDREGKLLAASDPLHDANAAGLWLGRLMQALAPQDSDPTFTRMWHLGPVIVAIRPSLASEQSEAGTNLLLSLLMLAGFSLVLFVGMKWVLARALHPLNHAIAQLGQLAHHQFKQDMAHSDVDEIQHINRAIHDLSVSLAQLESSRQLLSAKLISSQEDERAHISRELHDEFGQKLTVIRFNADYLRRTLPGDATAQQALADVQQAAQDIHAELRNLLARLRPQGRSAQMDNEALHDLLTELVNRWSQQPGQTAQFHLDMNLGHAALKHDTLLTVFRITQEALTNIAKHAQATQVHVCIRREESTLHWCVCDNGQGLGPDLPAAMMRGNGLSGMQQRVWAQGGELTATPDASSINCPLCDHTKRWQGTLLRARLPC